MMIIIIRGNWRCRAQNDHDNMPSILILVRLTTVVYMGKKAYTAMVMSTDNPDALFHPHLILDILPHPGRSPKKTTKTNTERKETKKKTTHR